uniref:Uncharacterized protein n=1 Tax=Gouania willdenowi TaxID=441366 RepID=A0A8C5GQS1_GOUWI
MMRNECLNNNVTCQMTGNNALGMWTSDLRLANESTFHRWLVPSNESEVLRPPVQSALAVCWWAGSGGLAPQNQWLWCP